MAFHKAGHTSTAITLLLGLLAACSGGDSGGSSEGPSAEDLPFGIRHVVVITIDTLRADYLGCYGHEFVQSPNLDRLAQEGVRFTQVMSAAPTTLASHTSLFTGKYPHTHGVPRNGYVVPEANEMLPEILGRFGFRSAGFAAAAPLDTDVFFHQGFDHYSADFSVTEDVREGIYQRSAPEVSAAALEWMDGAELKAFERLFLFLHYFDVHAPYTVPKPFGGMYSERGEPVDTSTEAFKRVRRGLLAEARSLAPGKRRNPPEQGFAQRLREGGGPGLTAAKAMIAEYAAGVTYTDHHVGELLQALEARGILEETLLVVTADHGETLYDHANVFNHGDSVYASETHVPLFMRFPRGQFAGLEFETPVSNVDVLPTILDLLDVRAPDAVEGVSLLALLNQEPLERGPIFAEATKPYDKPKFNDDPVWKNQGKYQAVREGRYKYIFRLPDKRFRLYDIEADPTEENNLLREPEGTPVSSGETLEDLEARLDLALRQWRAAAKPMAASQSDSEGQREALEALGYGGASDDPDRD